MTTSDRYPFLGALQISDSFFPIGGYSVSFGLETLAQSGEGIKLETVKSYLRDFLTLQILPADCVALLNVYKAASHQDLQKIIRIDKTLASMKLVEESYETSLKMGSRLLASANSFLNDPSLGEFQKIVRSKASPGTYPTCMALVTCRLDISMEDAARILAYSNSVSLLGAAVRLGLITHEQAQQVIHEAKPIIEEGLQSVKEKTEDEMLQFAPFIDVMGLRHKFLKARMFSA